LNFVIIYLFLFTIYLRIECFCNVIVIPSHSLELTLCLLYRYQRASFLFEAENCTQPRQTWSTKRGRKGTHHTNR